jgi:hypothetical protein
MLYGNISHVWEKNRHGAARCETECGLDTVAAL